MSIVAWDDKPSTADTDQHDDSGICPSCGHWYPESEYKQDWRDQLPEDAAYAGDADDTEAARIPLVKCCEGCVDDWFAANAPCVQRCADGSYEPA